MLTSLPLTAALFYTNAILAIFLSCVNLTEKVFAVLYFFSLVLKMIVLKWGIKMLKTWGYVRDYFRTFIFSGLSKCSQE